MSRRFQNINRPLSGPTTGEAIGTGLGILAGVMVLVIVGMALASMAPALARDLGQWDNTSAISQWYRALKQPDNPVMSCCGKADAYWADKVETGPNGELIAVITDDRPDGPLGRHHVPVGTRIVIPPHKIKFDQGNPTGHIVIFLTPANEVWCYVQNGGV